MLAAAAACVLGSACHKGRPASPLATPVAQSQTAATEYFGIRAGDRLYYNDGSALTDSVRIVIKTNADWADLWRRINANRASPPPPPFIDFSQFMLLVAGAGRMSPGDQIKVDSVGVGARDKTISVVVKTTVECRPFPGESYPLEIVRVQKSENRVLFLERRVKPGC